MDFHKPKKLRLSERDLRFLIETAAPGVSDKANLIKIIREDEDFRNSFICDEKIFRRLMDDEEALVKISPALYFEILLRRAARDLAAVGYTIEKSPAMSIPVFDTRDLAALLADDSVLTYLADMLSSFTKVESYSVSVRIRRGVWRKLRFSDLNMKSLVGLCALVEAPYRFALYKRIADLCLFMLGLFPEYVERSFRYPVSGKPRPNISPDPRINPAEYEQEGRRFYKMAAEHESARQLELSNVFRALHDHFQNAKKPLNFIAEHYLKSKRQNLFQL